MVAVPYAMFGLGALAIYRMCRNAKKNHPALSLQPAPSVSEG